MKPVNYTEVGAPVVMVDELRPYPDAKHRCFRAGACHLTVDGESAAHLEALHELAARIGMKRAWFQDHRLAPHYDLTGPRRAAALELGAVFVPALEQARARQRRRDVWRSAHEIAGALGVEPAAVEEALRATGTDRSSSVHARGTGSDRRYSPAVQLLLRREILR